MSIGNYFKKLMQGYNDGVDNRNSAPIFKEGTICRFNIVFTGHVQFVGFRYELQRIAETVGVTGWVMNDENDSGKVYAQLEGTREQTDYVINYMNSIDRIDIIDMDIKEIPAEGDEKFIVKNPY